MVITNSGVKLAFGVELELGLRPTPETTARLVQHYNFDDSDYAHQLNTGIGFPGPRDDNRTAIHEFIVDILEGCSMQVDLRDLNQPDYTVWQIEDDPTILEDKNTQADMKTYRVELVSPILSEDGWENELCKVFGVIKCYFEIIPMDFGSTHIHVAPKGRSWSQSEVETIGEGIISTSKLLCAAIPESERIKQWAKMNPLERFDAETIMEMLLKFEEYLGSDRPTMAEIVEVFSPDREATWNLRPLLNPPQGTIEFRRAPQSNSEEQAVHWITTMLCLIVLFLEEDDLLEFKLVKTRPGITQPSPELLASRFYGLIKKTATRFGLHGFIMA
ncbi:Nn.00g042520.m01.CDS01 [Neocucurbitaria sp. VM-36]